MKTDKVRRHLTQEELDNDLRKTAICIINERLRRMDMFQLREVLRKATALLEQSENAR